MRFGTCLICLRSTERCFLSLCLSLEVTGTEMTWRDRDLTPPEGIDEWRMS